MRTVINVVFYAVLGMFLGFVAFGNVEAIVIWALLCQVANFARVPSGVLALNVSKTSKALIEERSHAVSEMEKLISSTQKEKRDLAPEEETRWNHLAAQIEKIDADLPEVNKFEQNQKADAIAFGAKVGGDQGEARDQKTGTSWRNVDGSELRVYAPNEKIVSDRERGELTIGGIATALLKGARNDAERRALAEGQDSAGGVTVPQKVGKQFVDMFREQSATTRAGAQTVSLDSDNLTLAKIIADPTVAWRFENSDVAESQPVFDAVTWTPRSLACYVPVSRELVQDSVNIENILNRVLSEAMAAEIDRAGLVGSGVAPEPLGVANTPGVGSVSAGANGGAINDYSALVAAYAQLLTAGANAPTAAIMSPREFVRLNSLTVADGQPMEKVKLIADLSLISTKKMPTNQVQGTATNAGSIIIGDFKDLVYGVRQSIRLELLREAGFKKLQYIFLVTARVDVAVLHPESFATITGITPA